MYFGKVIAGLIGLLAGGIIGLVIGLIVGHFFDRALGGTFRAFSPANLRTIRDTFFDTTFLLSGHLAKADGRISEQEVAHTEQVFTQLGLSAEQRRRAIELFRRGAAAEFSPEAAIEKFIGVAGRQPQLTQMLLLFLISLAHADSAMEPSEHAVLVRIAKALGVQEPQLEQLIRMAQAQGQFHSGGGRSGAQATGQSLDSAYAALGVDSGVDDRALKRAYRKLMSEHHPDKLIARGVPEDMIKLATEKSQEIQAAYETVKRHRAAG